MNSIDDQLDRLFRTARLAAGQPEAVPPFGLETRALAAWRAAEPFAFWHPALLARGMLLALFIMGLSFWPVLHPAVSPTSDSLQLADSTLLVSNNL